MSDNNTQSSSTFHIQKGGFSKFLAEKSKEPAPEETPTLESKVTITDSNPLESNDDPKLPSDQSLVEGKEAETLSEDDPADKWLQKYKELASRDEDFLAKEKTLKEREELLRTKEEEEAIFKSDPVKILEKYGFDMASVVDKFLGIDPSEIENKEDDEPMPAWAKKFQERQDKIDQQIAEEKAAKEKAEKVREEQELQSFISSLKTNIRTSVADTEKFEAINSVGDIDENIETVFNVMAQHYKRTQSMMSIDQAAELVEKTLLEDVKKLLGGSLAQRLTGREKGETIKEPQTEQRQTLSSESNRNTYIQSSSKRANSFREYMAGKNVRR